MVLRVIVCLLLQWQFYALAQVPVNAFRVRQALRLRAIRLALLLGWLDTATVQCFGADELFLDCDG